MLGGFLLASGVFLSLWFRCRYYRQSPLATKQSLLTIAIQDLLATAGGIYLSLLAILSFLKCSLPDFVSWHGLSVDPIALASLLCSILQPFGRKINHWRRFYANQRIKR